ncbi:MAG: Flp pilus assembly complex ATPase component TadA [Oscillospiraceae bacterium]|nr:Flp pilus assembly complex ATPase component TadA [Oscillospiraceae bacterium]
MENSFKKLMLRIGKNAADAVLSAKVMPEDIREIRFCVNKPIQLVTNQKNFYINEKAFSIGEIQDIFAALCEYSVHTYKNEICEGFITAEGGCRIGICGTAVYENGKIINIKDISGLNIRIPHEIIGAANKLVPYSEHGLLITGPPCSGKTTLLRDIARQKSISEHVVIVDERTEIAGTYRGIPSFDVGNSSVLNGFSKSDGIAVAARSMAPDCIICDEFGGENDISSALFAMKSGVDIVASIHASDKEDLITKPSFERIIKNGIFEHIAFLNKKCEIYEIIKTKELCI